MNPDTSDRQSQAVYVVLIIVGLVLAAVGWARFIF
jgi:hypothetical protein